MSKISTPIADFVKNYAKSDFSRAHMPAHKGKSILGCEHLDITEINGADVLYSADGIIEESESNATELFGTAHTFYSTEGSTLSIKAMLAIAKKNAPAGRKILATRNVHKAFVYACALLDIEAEWLYPRSAGHLCDCEITPNDLRQKLRAMPSLPFALYVTSPNYLGKVLDIAGLSAVCKEFGIYLLVDNAHGAYLAFEEPPAHPIALGADICCDSAHKTLPTLTGGAYLHISKSFAHYDKNDARNMLSLFASTSPSYLILQSLDLTNSYIANGFRENLAKIEARINMLKAELYDFGFECEKGESLKIVLTKQKCAYSGDELAGHLRAFKIEPEYADRDVITLMLSTESTDSDLERIKAAFNALERRSPSIASLPSIPRPERVISMREALMSSCERIPTENSPGRICASPSVSCPPAIPPIVSGERIDSNTVNALLYYGITEIDVIK